MGRVTEDHTETVLVTNPSVMLLQLTVEGGPGVEKCTHSRLILSRELLQGRDHADGEEVDYDVHVYITVSRV